MTNARYQIDGSCRLAPLLGLLLLGGVLLIPASGHT